MQCSDLSSCFQAIYNILFVILIALAFLYFLYGAFLYLLSGAGIYNKQEGKNKMQNAIYSILVALIIPVILNTINPDIFQVQLKIPQVKVQLPAYSYKFEAGYLPGTDQPLTGPIKGKAKCDLNAIPNTSACHLDNLVQNSLVSSIFTSQNMKMFALICLNESGGDPAIESNVDRCRDGKPFSIGLFQINMTVTDFRLDDGTICKHNQIFDGTNFNCTVKNEELYEKCKNGLKNDRFNIMQAVIKYQERRYSFKPWSAYTLIQQQCQNI
jgi:hypothetical protein